MLKRLLRYLPLAIVAILLAGSAAVWFLTSAPQTQRTPSRAAANGVLEVDDRLLRSARQIAATADSPDEQMLAQEAVRTADHEVDQAFASALRDVAAILAAPRGPMAEIATRIAVIRERIGSEQARIGKLTPQAAKDDAAAEQLELAKAQLELDQNELEDARDDLARDTGDPHARLERALREHQAQQHSGQTPRTPLAGTPVTLADQVRLWRTLRDRSQMLDEARREAASRVGALRREHMTLESLAAKKPVTTGGDKAAADDEAPADLLARLQHLTDQRRTLVDLSKREQDAQSLAGVYKRWSAVLDLLRNAALHEIMRSIATLLAILLAVLILGRVIRHALGKEKDRRRLHQMRVIANVSVQVCGAVAALLVIFGAPTQTTTLIGLATAGLTVALKDFIVAFFGWFALIGKSGIHIGDWVEIEGVSGEVIEIGLLKTVLLEMGDSSNTGHPTGRRVAFVNKYAIENHYFNFSTAGQWLWDELQVTLPLGANPYLMAQNIRELVAHETEGDALTAEDEWQRVTKQYGTRSFSARPALDLKPTVNGIDVVVRYITRAPQRYDVKSRLFEKIVALLHEETTQKAIDVGKG